ncbi:nitroreductase/quinone reductase family protein [Actinoplanes sp. NPDC026619]|uniref:nitroreductase/quinone reductase family protein n=1 Tax=Actinoplanes sp. NPDC026619 TaxID=3155798 RepID=UPI0033D25807
MTFDGRNGTRGARQPGGPLIKIANKLTMGRIRRKAGALLILTTIGRKSGQERQSPLRWFPAGDTNAEGWLIVASAGGGAQNPAWYYNLKANPDQAWVELGDQKVAVTAEQLHGAEHEAAWQRITTEAAQFAGYQTKTDRDIPVIKLTPRA